VLLTENGRCMKDGLKRGLSAQQDTTNGSWSGCGMGDEAVTRTRKLTRDVGEREREEVGCVFGWSGRASLELLRWRGEGDGETTTNVPAHIDSRPRERSSPDTCIRGQSPPLVHTPPFYPTGKCMPRRRKKARRPKLHVQIHLPIAATAIPPPA
jgi:hypothetical protein